MPAKIGCIAICPAKFEGGKQYFHAIECKKGRGLILPGGKWEEGESLHACAIRELFEETGIVATKPVYVFGGVSTSRTGAYIYAFRVENTQTAPHIETKEGIPALATWDDLCRQGVFAPYYMVLAQEYARRFTPEFGV